MPEYQGRGLSKALISYLMNMAVEIEGDRDFYLHTQTWSHRAIKLYEKFGFEITEEPNLFKYRNDEYEEAREVLKEIYSHYPKDRR
jgi:ribosomal protein S18 acetylase RimI-like enzyme